MKRLLFGVLLGAVLGGSAMYAAFSYSVVRADGEWLMVRKPQASLDRFVIDIRGWSVAEWTQNADLARALIDRGRRDLIKPLDPGQMLEDVLRGFGQAANDRDRRQSH